MVLMSELSIYRMASLLGLFFLLLGLFSLKTIYYYSSDNLAWWMYLAGITFAFLYAVYYCLSEQHYWFYVLALLSILIGYVPYEIELPRVVALIVNPELNLSGLSKKLPLFAGMIVDIFFYPLLVFMLLLMAKKIITE